MGATVDSERVAPLWRTRANGRIKLAQMDGCDDSWEGRSGMVGRGSTEDRQAVKPVQAALMAALVCDREKTNAIWQQEGHRI